MRVVFFLPLNSHSLPFLFLFHSPRPPPPPLPFPPLQKATAAVLYCYDSAVLFLIFSLSPLPPLPPLSSPPLPPPPTHPLTPPLSKKPTLTVLREKKNGLFKRCLKTLMFSKIFAIHLAYDLHKVLVFRLIPFMNMCEQDI